MDYLLASEKRYPEDVASTLHSAQQRLGELARNPSHHLLHEELASAVRELERGLTTTTVVRDIIERSRDGERQPHF